MKLQSIATGLFLLVSLLTAPSVHAWFVAQPNGRYKEATDDLRVKVPGGHVRVEHAYNGEKWQINPAWSPLVLAQDSSTGVIGITGIERNGVVFLKDATGLVFMTPDSGRYLISPLWAVGVTPTAIKEAIPAGVTGFRWEDRWTQDWIEYGADLRIRAYGDRNNVTVRFQYTDELLTGVLDQHGRLVLSFEYTQGVVVAVHDHPASGEALPQRVVRYAYDSMFNLQKVTDVHGYDTIYGYDAGQHSLISVTDAENQVRSISRGSAGKVSSVQDMNGAQTDYEYTYDKLKKEFTVATRHPVTEAGRETEVSTYDSEGRLLRTDVNGETRLTINRESARKSTTTDGLGQQTVTEKDEFGHVTKATYADGSTTTAKYSPLHGRMLEDTDELDVKFIYEYDDHGNLLKQTEAAGLPEARVTEYTRDADSQILTQTIKGNTVTLPTGQTVTSPDATTTYTYDAVGNVASVTDAEGHTSRFTYNRLGQVLTRTDALGKVWSRSYDARGNLLSETNPLAQTTTATYDKLNRRKTIVDALNHTTAYEYDAWDNVTHVTDALGQVKGQQYDARGHWTAKVDEAGKALRTVTYDVAGLPIELRDANGNSALFTFDTGFQITRIQYPTYSEDFTYDQRGRKISRTQVLDANTHHTQQQTYDAKGQPTSTTDANGKVTRQHFDGLGRLIEVVNAAAGRTRYTYDSRDNLMALTDPNNHSTVFSYDRNNRVLSETRPAGETQRYSYDVVGNLETFTDAKGNQVGYGYDAADRRTTETYTAAGAQQPIRTITYAFNTAGSLSSWQDNNQADGAVALSTAYTLDALQRITQETVNYDSLSLTTQTAYHSTGRPKSLTYPDGYTVQYGYDANQILDSLVLPEGTIRYQQKRWNRPQQILFPGGSQQSQTFDPLMRLTEKRVLSPGQQERYLLTNTYDPESSITRQAGTNGTVDYSYDNLYRLTAADQPWPLSDETYSYDLLSNRLTDSRRGGSQTWTYNANNQLLQSFSLNGSAITHSYDANGSLINKTSSAQEIGLNQQLTYDAANRLTEVRDSSNALIARYQYDPLGRRISKTVFPAMPAAPVTTYFVYGREGLLAEVNAQGETITDYGWQPEGLWGTNPQFIRTRPSNADANTSQSTYYYQNDHLGTPRTILDNTGAVVWAQQGYAFGEVAEFTTQTIRNPLRFPGQYADDETGTYYNYFRDYSPQTGRYIESDPIGLAGGLNTYAYVKQNPNSFVDPAGLALRGPGTSRGGPGGTYGDALGNGKDGSPPTGAPQSAVEFAGTEAAAFLLGQIPIIGPLAEAGFVFLESSIGAAAVLMLKSDELGGCDGVNCADTFPLIPDLQLPLHPKFQMCPIK